MQYTLARNGSSCPSGAPFPLRGQVPSRGWKAGRADASRKPHRLACVFLTRRSVGAPFAVGVLFLIVMDTLPLRRFSDFRPRLGRGGAPTALLCTPLLCSNPPSPYYVALLAPDESDGSPFRPAPHSFNQPARPQWAGRDPLAPPGRYRHQIPRGRPHFPAPKTRCACADGRRLSLNIQPVSIVLILRFPVVYNPWKTCGPLVDNPYFPVERLWINP